MCAWSQCGKGNGRLGVAGAGELHSMEQNKISVREPPCKGQGVTPNRDTCITRTNGSTQGGWEWTWKTMLCSSGFNRFY